MSAWGDSWGASWGDAWGPLVEIPGAMRGAAHGSCTAVATLTMASAEVLSFGGRRRPRVTALPGWITGPQPTPKRYAKEEDEALLLCTGGL